MSSALKSSRPTSLRLDGCLVPPDGSDADMRDIRGRAAAEGGAHDGVLDLRSAPSSVLLAEAPMAWRETPGRTNSKVMPKDSLRFPERFLGIV